MPRPVFPVVRLPYDRPDRVARVLDAVRRELGAAGRRSVAMTARVLTATRREPEKNQSATCAVMQQQLQAACSEAVSVDQTAVEHVTVGVRDCTLTPKARPEITVTAGGAARNNAFLDDPQNRSAPTDGASCCGGAGGPFLLVPPVNITAEISRPPLQYTATS